MQIIVLKKQGSRASSHSVQKSKKPDPDNILASGTEKLVRDDSKSFSISATLPQGGATLLPRNNLNPLRVNNTTIGDLGVGIWKSFFRASTFANNVIKTKLETEARLQEPDRELKALGE